MRWTWMTIMPLFALVTSLAGAQERAHGDSVPREHYPPAGMCRIWLDGVPPTRQPAPTDCVSAVRNRPTNARVLFGGNAGRRGARVLPRSATAFRAGSALNGSCVDRDTDGACDETWAKPTPPLPPLPKTASQSAVQEHSVRGRAAADSAVRGGSKEKPEKPREP